MSDTVKIVLLIAVITLALATTPSGIGLLLCLILVIVTVNAMLARRRSVDRDLNSALQAVCHHEGSVAKVAIAYSRGGPLSGRCYDYARRLIAGQNPVDAAVASRLPLQLSTVVVMESPSPSTGTHAANEIDAADSSFVDDEGPSMPVAAQLTYLTIASVATIAVLVYVSMSSSPELETMFEEFGLTIPFQGLLKAQPALWAFASFVMVLVVAVPILARGHLFGRKITWFPTLPGVAQRQADLLRGMADGIDAGWPIGRALTTAHAISLRRGQRQSLEVAIRLVQSGMPTAAAMSRIGMINERQQAWFDGASSERTAELLRAVADQSIRDAQMSMRWIMSILFPCVILILGAAVLVYAIAFYGTLAGLINGLS